uniref:Uncharacterized protein n=1 Tax=Cacopsylla melanoneura TaxID=428564 RepID=A0A8D9EL01_9HEMI
MLIKFQVLKSPLCYNRISKSMVTTLAPVEEVGSNMTYMNCSPPKLLPPSGTGKLFNTGAEIRISEVCIVCKGSELLSVKQYWLLGIGSKLPNMLLAGNTVLAVVDVAGTAVSLETL